MAHACSFCRKSERHGRRLIPSRIASEKFCICDRCLDVCNRILDEGPELPGHKRFDAEMRCSFCDRPHSAVRKLISSPNWERRAYICDECVVASKQILAETPTPPARSRLVRWIDDLFQGKRRKSLLTCLQLQG